MSTDSTTEHLAILKDERNAIHAPRACIMMNELLPDAAKDGWNTGSAMTLSSTSLLSAPRSKIKTRPDVSTSNADVAEVTPVIEQTEILLLVTIQVKPESMRVLTRMFPCTPENIQGSRLIGEALLEQWKMLDSLPRSQVDLLLLSRKKDGVG